MKYGICVCGSLSLMSPPEQTYWPPPSTNAILAIPVPRVRHAAVAQEMSL
jgi:hypothetical protein